MTNHSISEADDLARQGNGAIDPAPAPAGAPQWRGEVRQVDELADDEIVLWRHLTATRHELRSPYFSVEFARAVAEAGVEARVCVLYHHGILAGFFPFQFRNRFAQFMAAGERIGGDLNDFCGVLLDRSRHPAIGPRELLRCAGLASFEFSHLEETQPELGLSGVRSDAARIRLDDGLGGYWAGVKSNHASGYDTLRNRERKIDREFRSADFVFAHEECGELLNLVVSEKRKQFGRTGAPDGFAEPWKLRCLDRIARYRSGSCLPVLSSLHLDGSWAALHFGIRAGGVLHSAFPVYNAEFAKLSPGLVLLAKIIGDAPNHGIKEIDLSEGSSGYKSLVATEFYPIYRGVWHRATARGIAYRAGLSARWRLQGLRGKQL